jgi:arylsulfatase A-like enzyme
MNRRAFLLAQSAAAAAAARAARPPNIVFLLTDDQRWDTLGCMGNRIIRTPNIDALSRGGVTFDNAFVTTSICMASRASIFTGQYERTHGMHAFSSQLSPAQFARTYPALLRAAGYRTGFIGKYGLDGKPLPEDQFDYWRGFPGQGSYFPQGEPGPHLTRIMGDQALEYLAGCSAQKPFFLQVSFKAPHVEDNDPRQFLYDPEDESLYRDVEFPWPMTAQPGYISSLPVEVHRSENRRRWAVRFSTPELYQQSVKAYYRLITGVDRVAGRILEQLRRQSLDRDTVIVFSSDNGFFLSEHGLAGKWLMHEESIRVPLIVFDPRAPQATRGMRRKEMALNIDIAPTLLRLAGIEPPPSMQGRDLTPLLEGRKVPWRTEWFYEHPFRANGWIVHTEGVRTERWKYARYLSTNPVFEELFDLSADPLEERNLALETEHRGQLERLRERWRAWRSHLESYDPAVPWREPS